MKNKTNKTIELTKNEITKDEIYVFLSSLNDLQIDYLERQIKNKRLREYLRSLNN
jgi:hypothetical protein